MAGLSRVQSSLIASVLLLAACGGMREGDLPTPVAREAPSPGTTPGPTSEATCADLWAEVRGSLVESGARDGEARRQADLARIRCEDELASGLAQPSPVEFACAEDEHLRDASVPEEPGIIGAYFSCAADIGTEGEPVYRFLRASTVGPADSSSGLEAAVLAYLDGLTDEERARGYLSAIPGPFPGGLDVASVEGNQALVNFAPAFEERVGSFASTAGRVFLAELAATVFQLEQVEEITVAIAGDCERFWRMLESSCQVVDRPPSP
jgi:hypothetical protein